MEKPLALGVFLLTLFLVIAKPKNLGIGWSAWLGAITCLALGLVSFSDTSGEKLFKQPRLPEETIPNSITLKVSK
jgi:Na+/H+ antiporter NhaD/arsenite permease-like protein